MPAPRTADEFLAIVQKSGVADDMSLSAYLARLRAGGAMTPEQTA